MKLKICQLGIALLIAVTIIGTASAQTLKTTTIDASGLKVEVSYTVLPAGVPGIASFTFTGLTPTVLKSKGPLTITLPEQAGLYYDLSSIKGPFLTSTPVFGSNKLTVTDSMAKNGVVTFTCAAIEPLMPPVKNLPITIQAN